MKILASAALAAACLVGTPALAQGVPMYASVGATMLESGDVSLGAVTGRVGANLTKYVGLEGEAAFGFRDDSVEGVDIGLGHDIAAYVTASLPMTDNARIIARAGYGSTSIDVDGEDDMEVRQWRYGVGAEFFFDDANGIRIDYTRFPRDAMEGSSYTVSYVRKFGL